MEVGRHPLPSDPPQPGETFIWSRGEELVTQRFPELGIGDLLPEGTVIDGEILPWKDDLPLPFAQLQRRIGRKVLGPKILADVPVVLLAYDLLEWQGADIRDWPIERRRAQLAEVVPGGRPPVGPVAAGRVRDLGRARRASARVPIPARGRFYAQAPRFTLPGWQACAATGGSGRSSLIRSTACLIYAQPGNGKRASLLTDYTFGIWDDGELVPFAKAYSGLTNDEIAQVDAWVRQNTSKHSARSARSNPNSSSNWPSKEFRRARATAPGSPSVSRAWRAGVRTRRPKTPTLSRRFVHCCRHSQAFDPCSPL